MSVSDLLAANQAQPGVVTTRLHSAVTSQSIECPALLAANKVSGNTAASIHEPSSEAESKQKTMVCKSCGQCAATMLAFVSTLGILLLIFKYSALPKGSANIRSLSIVHRATLSNPSVSHPSVSCTALVSAVHKNTSTPQTIGTGCASAWAELREILMPTQRDIGFDWVQRKARNDFKSFSAATLSINKKRFPVVISPWSKLYLVDGHHRLAALDLAEYFDVQVLVTVVDDLRHIRDESKFWAALKIRGHALLVSSLQPQQFHVLPQELEPSDMPKSFAFNSQEVSFVNNPWRTLVGYSLKVSHLPFKEECPAANRHCYMCFCNNNVDVVQYAEFYWAFFIQSSTFKQESYFYWDHESSRIAFRDAWISAFNAKKSVSVSERTWETLAALAVLLCRSSRTDAFVLPPDLFSAGSLQVRSLPGVILGYEPSELICHTDLDK